MLELALGVKLLLADYQDGMVSIFKNKMNIALVPQDQNKNSWDILSYMVQLDWNKTLSNFPVQCSHRVQEKSFARFSF